MRITPSEISMFSLKAQNNILRDKAILITSFKQHVDLDIEVYDFEGVFFHVFLNSKYNCVEKIIPLPRVFFNELQ